MLLMQWPSPEKVLREVHFLWLKILQPQNIFLYLYIKGVAFF